MTETHQGRCFCGAVRFEFETPVKWTVACHCESCRRQCSAPFTVFVGVPDGQWRWTAGAPQLNPSSSGVERLFCGDCGSPLTFRSTGLTDILHFHAAALENPEAFPPERHVAIEEKLGWLHLNDDLPTTEGPRSV